MLQNNKKILWFTNKSYFCGINFIFNQLFSVLKL